MSRFDARLDKLSELSSYVKPESHDGLRLDSNENLVISTQIQDKISAGVNTDIREYPIDGTEKLIRHLSAHLNIPEQYISVGNGSDQILDLMLSKFAGHTVLVSDPTFSFFVDRCNLHGIQLVRVPYDNDMSLDIDKMIQHASKADMIYLDSPNNPTGYQIPKNDLHKLVTSCDIPIILDEAYADFGEYSAYTLVPAVPRLIVVRTLSKSFGLAGLRVGYMVAEPRIADIFNRIVQYPYPISTISIQCAVRAIQLHKEISASWDIIKSERTRVVQSLREFGAFTVFGSSANFVLFDAGGSYRRIHQALAEQGIRVRMLGPIGDTVGCLRVSVGTPKMNSRFLLAVRDLLK